MWQSRLGLNIGLKQSSILLSVFALLFSVTSVVSVQNGAYAQNVSAQVNRKNKTDQLPKSQWGSTVSELAKRLPKTRIGQQKTPLNRNYKASGGNESYKAPTQYVNARPNAKLPVRQPKVNNRIPSSFQAPVAKKPAIKQPPRLTPSRPILPVSNVNNVPIRKGLARFFEDLRQTVTGKRTDPVTILHLGDDHIARDRFSGDLREMFQSRFGDSGRGMIMPGPVFPFFRAQGVRIKSTGNWEVNNSLEGKGGIFGLTAVTYSSKDPKAFVEMSSSGKPFSWAEVSFLTGPESGRAILWVHSQQNAFQRLKGGAGDAHQQIIETYTRQYGIRRVRFPASASSLTVFPEGEKPITLLSWQTGHDNPGVRYVNLGLPKATASMAQNLDAEFVQKDIQSINPSLIVLSYGTNEGFNRGLDAEAYQQEFTRLIQNLKQLAPKASILVLGPPDVAFLPAYARGSAAAASKACSVLDKVEAANYDNLLLSRASRLARWHPPVKLESVRNAIRQAASEQGAFFWDWSRIMGGPCGIHAWVHSNPKLAADNHKSLTGAGARRSAKALFSVLMTGFEAYQQYAASNINQ